MEVVEVLHRQRLRMWRRLLRALLMLLRQLIVLSTMEPLQLMEIGRVMSGVPMAAGMMVHSMHSLIGMKLISVAPKLSMK